MNPSLLLGWLVAVLVGYVVRHLLKKKGHDAIMGYFKGLAAKHNREGGKKGW